MAGITALRTLRSRSILGRRVLITGAADGTNHQGVIDADTRLVVAVGRPLPGNRNDCKTWELSGAKEAVGKTTVIAERRLPGHRPGHPAPPRARPSRTPGLESPRPRRAHLHPDEGLEDPPRLPTERRRCPPRHARNPPPVQPRPRRVTQKPSSSSNMPEIIYGTTLSQVSPRLPPRDTRTRLWSCAGSYSLYDPEGSQAEFGRMLVGYSAAQMTMM